MDKAVIALVALAASMVLILVGAVWKSDNQAAAFEKWCIEAGGRVIKMDHNSFCAKNFELIKENVLNKPE